MVWDGLTVVEKITFDTSSTVEIQNAITALSIKHGVPNFRIVADEDGVGGGVVDSLRCCGFVNNSKANNPAYGNLKSECESNRGNRCVKVPRGRSSKSREALYSSINLRTISFSIVVWFVHGQGAFACIH